MSNTQYQVFLSVVAHKSSLGVRKILSPTGLEDSHNGHQMIMSPAHKEACILIDILEPVIPSILDFSTMRSSNLDSFRLYSNSDSISNIMEEQEVLKLKRKPVRY